jgi:hypothetical protein
MEEIPLVNSVGFVLICHVGTQMGERVVGVIGL